MQREEFIKLQYQTLREKIKETKQRIFKIMGFGIVIIPAANYLANTYSIDTLIFSLPILVLVVALMYLSENNSLMRCGRYIKDHIELLAQNIVGWEEWLETSGSWDKRGVDKYVNFAFYLLFFVYFVGSVFLASRFAFEKFGPIFAAPLTGAYVAIGVWFVIYLIYKIKFSTTTDPEK